MSNKPTILTRFIIVVLCALNAVLLTAHAAAAPADDFLTAWSDASDQPSNATTIWQDFIKANPNDDLAQVARLKLAITLWQQNGKPADITPHLRITAPERAQPTPLRTQVIAAGNAIEARLRMQQIAAALQDYHAKHIEYPASLDELASAKLLDQSLLRDPFGQAWAYEATARRAAPNLPRQHYTLSCTTIKRSHRDVANDLEHANDDVTQGFISSVVPAQQQAFVKWYNRDGSEGAATSWTVGNLANRYTLWFVHSRFVLVGDAGIPKLMRAR